MTQNVLCLYGFNANTNLVLRQEKNFCGKVENCCFRGIGLECFNTSDSKFLKAQTKGAAFMG